MNNGYVAVSVEDGKQGAIEAFERRYGRAPFEVLFAKTCYLAGPIPGAAPLFDPTEDAERPVEVGQFEQATLF